MNQDTKLKLKIGSHELNAYFSEEPVDGFNYTVETDGIKDSKYKQRFYPIKLKGVTAKDFPESTDLSIYNHKSNFSYINMLWVRKKHGITELTILVEFTYSEWELTESLAKFVDRFRNNAIKTNIVNKSSSSKTEYGYDISFITELMPDDDIYKKICELEEIIESTYRNSLVPINNNITIRNYGEDKLHWWIRYVIVPVICSGGIVAVIAKYLKN